MSRVSDGRITTPTPTPAGAASRESLGQGLRRDLPHTSASAPPAPQSQSGYDLLAQTEQIADRIKEQFVDVDRREQRINAQLAQIDDERRNIRLWITQVQEEFEERHETLNARETDLSQRTSTCVELEQQLQHLHEELLREQARVADERRHLEGDRDEKLALVRQERTLLENRIRFQQDHLERTRTETESAQNELRLERQRFIHERESSIAQDELRRRQINTVRDLLDDREASIERESQFLIKNRRALEEVSRSQREQLASERDAWEQERDDERAELRRQQDLLAAQAENLETRRVRLDSLRAELEENNRRTLEMRLAVEEAQVQFLQAAGHDVGRERLEDARHVLGEFYRHTRDGLAQQRKEIESLQQTLQSQMSQHQRERQEVQDWVAVQTEQFAAQKRGLDGERSRLRTEVEALHLARERWLADRHEAEAVIRELLHRLEERESPAA